MQALLALDQIVTMLTILINELSRQRCLGNYALQIRYVHAMHDGASLQTNNYDHSS